MGSLHFCLLINVLQDLVLYLHIADVLVNKFMHTVVIGGRRQREGLVRVSGRLRKGIGWGWS